MAFGWRIEKFSRRLTSRVYGQLYRDGERDMSRCILLAGTARSGSTWLADVIASQAPCRIMFEPFHRDKIPALSGLQYFQYLRPGEEHEALNSFCQRLFRGEIRDSWIDREIRCLRPGYRLIKEIRANLFLGWLHERFPDVRMMLLFRHPCAVVASRVSLDWATDGDLDSFLEQPALSEQIPMEALQRIRTEGSDVEKHAAIWCVSYLVPLRQFAGGGIPCVFYEAVVADPQEELPRVFHAAGLPYDDSVFRRLSVPSTTSVAHSAVTKGKDRLSSWKARLSNEDVEAILGVLETFGLAGLYGRGEMPLTHDPWASLPGLDQ